MARQWSAGCYGVARHREGSRQNSIGGSGVLSLRHFGRDPFIPWQRGCRRIWRGVILVYWFRRGRGCRPHDAEVAGGAVADLGLLISGPRDNTNSRLRPRGGAAGQAVVCRLLRGRSPPTRHREGSRQNSRRGLGRALSPAFRAGSLYPFIPLARGCRRIWRGVILVYWFRRGRGCRPHDGEVAGGAVADLVLLISGPRDNTNSRLRPRGGADGQAVVCPLLRGSSPPRGVAPKQQEGSRACSLSGISGWFSLSLYPLGAWVPKNLARRNFGLLVSAGPRLLAARCRGRRRRRRRFSFINFRAPR